MEIKITSDKLAAALSGERKRVRACIPKASLAACHRLRARIIDEIDKRKITDRGILKNGVRVANRGTDGRFQGGASVIGDAPHTGIVELGARPHPVSKEGRDAIAGWCVRKLGMEEKDAARMAWFISKKIAEVGQKPTYVFRDCVPDGLRFFGEEMVRILNSTRPT